MNSVAAELVVIVAALYLLDCFRWVGRSAMLVRRWPWSRARLEAPWRIAPQFSRRLAFGLPLPVEQLLVAEGACLRPLAEGLWLSDDDLGSWARPGREAKLVPWGELENVQVVGLELVGAGRRHQFGSRRAAAAARAFLSTAKKRRSLRSYFDADEVERRLASVRGVRPLVRLTTCALLAALSALLWAVFEPRVPWSWFLAPLGVTWVSCLVVASVAIRRVLPAEVRPSRWQWVLLLISPLSLIRTLDVIEGELVTDFDPGVVAMVACEAAEAQRVVAQRLRALAYPLVHDDGPHHDDLALREELSALLRAAASARGLTLDQRTPAGRHCPRCHTEYRADVVTCSSCPGVALVS